MQKGRNLTPVAVKEGSLFGNISEGPSGTNNYDRTSCGFTQNSTTYYIAITPTTSY